MKMLIMSFILVASTAVSASEITCFVDSESVKLGREKMQQVLTLDDDVNFSFSLGLNTLKNKVVAKVIIQKNDTKIRTDIDFENADYLEYESNGKSYFVRCTTAKIISTEFVP